MSETRVDTESSQLFEYFFTGYQARYARKDSEDTKRSDTEEDVLARILREIEEKGPDFTLYHGTHSGFSDTVLTRTLPVPLFGSVSPFHSAQVALQRSYSESGVRRLHSLPSVVPVLFEIKVDLRGLSYDVIHPSPDARVTKEIGIGIARDMDSGVPGVFEIQLVGPEAEKRFQQARLDIVASGNDAYSLLSWSKEHISRFPLDILLPK